MVDLDAIRARLVNGEIAGIALTEEKLINRLDRWIENDRDDIEALLAEVNRLRMALSAIIEGIETHDSPDGICRWNRWEHDAVAAARAALTDD